MDYKILKTAADTITMPDDAKRRIVSRCKSQISQERKEIAMKTSRNHTFIRKPAAALAVVAICLSLAVTAVAASGTLKGFFRDITDYRGAVVGTAYQQATDEINVDAAVNGNELTILAVFADPKMAPYREAEKLGIAAYEILDASENTVMEGTVESTKVANGQAALSISLEGLEHGSYKLVVTAFVSEKKADQPLTISGHWECAFTK